MLKLYTIAAMSENRAIANRGKLPWQLPLEYRWFKHKTLDHAIVMGRKTCEAIGNEGFKHRYVLSHKTKDCFGAKCYLNFDSLFSALPSDRPAWVVGGAEIYRQLFPRCTYVYLSRIKRTTPGDVFLPVFEDQFTLNQIIHENEDFRVERWLRNGVAAGEPEAWPFAS